MGALPEPPTPARCENMLPETSPLACCEDMLPVAPSLAWHELEACVAQVLAFSDVRSRLVGGLVNPHWRVQSCEPRLWGTCLDLRGVAQPHRVLRALLSPGAPTSHRRWVSRLTDLHLEFSRGGVVDADLALVCGFERLHLNAIHGVTAVGLSALAANNPDLIELSLCVRVL